MGRKDEVPQVTDEAKSISRVESVPWRETSEMPRAGHPGADTTYPWPVAGKEPAPTWLLDREEG